MISSFRAIIVDTHDFRLETECFFAASKKIESIVGAFEQAAQRGGASFSLLSLLLLWWRGGGLVVAGVVAVEARHGTPRRAMARVRVSWEHLSDRPTARTVSGQGGGGILSS